MSRHILVWMGQFWLVRPFLKRCLVLFFWCLFSNALSPLLRQIVIQNCVHKVDWWLANILDFIIKIHTWLKVDPINTFQEAKQGILCFSFFTYSICLKAWWIKHEFAQKKVWLKDAPEKNKLNKPGWNTAIEKIKHK